MALTAIGPRNSLGANAELKFSEDELLATLCRKSYFRFVQEMWDTVVPERPVWNWHLQEMCDRIQVMCERVFFGRPKVYDLCTNVPPGMSKSLVHSVMLPAWCWTRMPSFKFIGASYSYPLAQELSVKTRDVVMSDKYHKLFPTVTLREDQNTKGHFKTLQGGGRYAVGVNGSVTGFHAHLIVVDDPLDPNQAASLADLNAANRWIRETLPSRKVDKTVVPMILVMQRLHQDDPTAQMVKRGGVFRLCLPATDEDPVRPARLKAKYVKGLLDPVRLPRKTLEETEQEMGEVAYAAQYRERPSPPGGAMFKVGGKWTDEKTHVRGLTASVKFTKLVRFWDKAGCLVAGTLVETINGPKRIEAVQEGDLVLTRGGYRLVEWAGVSGCVDEVFTAKFSDGRELSGTFDHPVLTERGWVALESLRCYDNLISLYGGRTCQGDRSGRKTRSSSCTVGSSTGGGPVSGIFKPTVGTRRRRGNTPSHYTRPSGGTITALSRVGITSITRTKITTTTTSPTWSALPGVTTIGSTLTSGRLLNTESCLLDSVLWHSKGSGRCTPSDLITSTPASIRSAIRSSRAGHSTELFLNTVPPNAETGSTDSKVEQLSGRIPVYDLHVEGDHEFYANGVLVHNTQGGRGPFTAGVLLAEQDNGLIWVLDAERFKLDVYGREQAILDRAHLDRKAWGEVTVGLEQEPGSGGKESLQATVRRLRGFNVWWWKVDSTTGGKELRAEPLAAQVNAGNVILLDDGAGGARWNDAFAQEFKFFPSSRWKDQVDAASGGFQCLSGGQVRAGALR